MNTTQQNWTQLIQNHQAEWQDWRWHMRHAARKPIDFVKWGILSEQEAMTASACMQRYQTLVTPYYLSLINPHHSKCPISLQAIPKAEELEHLPQESMDPIGDHSHQVTPLLIHRYPDRVLMFPTYQCPMYCRYCFRKDTLSQEKIQLQKDLPKSIAYINQHPEIHEVILSGGDPLLLSDQRLKKLIQELNQTHIKRIRIHTRFPVTLPQRITTELLESLHSDIPIAMVTHFNHPKEITSIAQQAIHRLRSIGILLFNQTVLLADVNNQVDTLSTLFQKLFTLGMTPYYLHHPDLTAGTQHFRVSLEEGLRLMKQIKGSISGLALPQYVIDIPGGKGKVNVDSSYVQEQSPGIWHLHSPLDQSITLYRDLAYES